MTTANQVQPSAESAVAGRVVRVIGPVVDVEFPRGQQPALFNALTVEVDLEACLLYTSDAADDIALV